MFAAGTINPDIFKSVRRADKRGALYMMDYSQDIGLDSVLNAEITDIFSLINYAGGRMLSNVDSLLMNLEPGCSSFTAFDEGKLLFGRNFDYVLDESAALLVHTTPENGYESIGFSDIGGLGFKKGSLDDGKTDLSFLVLSPLLMTDGMNEKGLVVSAMTLDEDPACQDRGKKKIMTTIAMRMLLDRAANVDEAIILLDEYDMQCPNPPLDFHFMIADASGNSKVVEYVNNEMKVLDARVATNFYLAEPLKGKGHGHERYDIMRNCLEAKDFRLTVSDSVNLLKASSQNGNEESGSYTLFSVVYDTGSKTVNAVVERNYDSGYIYTLGSGSFFNQRS